MNSVQSRLAIQVSSASRSFVTLRRITASTSGLISSGRGPLRTDILAWIRSAHRYCAIVPLDFCETADSVSWYVSVMLDWRNPDFFLLRPSLSGVMALVVVSSNPVSSLCLFRFASLSIWWEPDTVCEACRDRLPRPSSSPMYLCFHPLGDETQVRFLGTLKCSWGVVGVVELPTYTSEVRERCNWMDFRRRACLLFFCPSLSRFSISY